MTSNYLYATFSKLTATALLFLTAVLCSSLIILLFNGLRAAIEHIKIVHP